MSKQYYPSSVEEIWQYLNTIPNNGFTEQNVADYYNYFNSHNWCNYKNEPIYKWKQHLLNWKKTQVENTIINKAIKAGLINRMGNVFYFDEFKCIGINAMKKVISEEKGLQNKINKLKNDQK
jgi:hypothetical protein